MAMPINDRQEEKEDVILHEREREGERGCSSA
jgi:hypothetical protein